MPIDIFLCYVFMLVLIQVSLWYKLLFEDVRISAIYNGVWYNIYDSHMWNNNGNFTEKMSWHLLAKLNYCLI